MIQVRLGHASIRTTLDLYGHLMPGLDDLAVDALEQMIDDLAPGSRRVEGDEDLGQEAWHPLRDKGFRWWALLGLNQ